MAGDLGNFFLGGAIGLLAVDPLTGGMWTLDPERVNVQLTPASASIDGVKISVLTIAQLSNEQRSHLLPIPRARN